VPHFTRTIFAEDVEMDSPARPARDTEHVGADPFAGAIDEVDPTYDGKPGAGDEAAAGKAERQEKKGDDPGNRVVQDDRVYAMGGAKREMSKRNRKKQRQENVCCESNLRSP
jgi:hypothetical protein